MGVCSACKGDSHGQHRPKETVPTYRSGLQTAGHLIECKCVECCQPADWRGAPQPIPDGAWVGKWR
jgi:hypothetical protein